MVHGRQGVGEGQAVLGSRRVGGRVELVMWQLRKGTAAPQLWMAIAHHFGLRLMPHALCCRAHQLQFRSAALLCTTQSYWHQPARPLLRVHTELASCYAVRQYHCTSDIERVNQQVTELLKDF